MLVPPELAPITVVPTPAVVAKPGVLGALAIVATDDTDELQWTFIVMSWVVLSLNVPVAVNCRVPLTASDELAGVTAIETSVGAVTVRTVEPLIDPDVALIVDVPMATPVARPELLIVAVAVVSEAQVTELVMFCVLLSL